MIDIKEFIGEEIVGGKTFVTVTVSDEADEAAFRTIVFSKPAFIAPVTLSEENGEQIFSYDVTAERFIKVSMMPNAMSPLEFLAFMKNLTKAVVSCDDYFMNPLNLLVSEEHIYINPNNYDVRLIYAPFCEPVFTEAEISGSIFRISRRFAKTSGDGWQDIITRLWNMSDSMSVYNADELFSALYDENSGKQHDSEAAERIADTPEWRLKPVEAPAPEPVQTFAVRQEINVISADIPRELEPDKKKRGLFGLSDKSDKKEAKKEQIKPPKKQEKNQEKVGMFSSQLSGEKPIVSATNEEPKAPKEAKGFFSLGHRNKSEQPQVQQYSTSSWAQSSVADDATQPPPGAYGQYDDDTTQPPPGYMDISSARFDCCASNRAQNLPETIRVEFKAGAFIIGRVKNGKNTSDFAFPEATAGVSHLHARITEKEGQYYITDMNTRYGTFVGFHKITPMKEVELNDGEKVSFSTGVDYEFRIERGR